MARIQKFEDVIAWQKSKLLAIEVHELFKDARDFSFKDQVFRASLSIMNNIAEGFDRSSDKELRNFLNIARGSAAEVRSMLIIALDFKYLSASKQKELLQITDEISKLLSGFIKKLDERRSETKNKRLAPRD